MTFIFGLCMLAAFFAPAVLVAVMALALLVCGAALQGRDEVPGTVLPEARVVRRG